MDTAEQFLAGLLDDLKGNRLKLPTLPEAAVQIRKVIEDGEASAAQIARIIGIDLALATRLMQVANGPLYRGTTKIDSLQTAVARLGIDQVRSLVTSLLMQQIFQTRHPGLKRRVQELWLHSTRVAAISEMFARRFTRLSPEQAMLAGLIHDIGALPILARAESVASLAENPAALDEAVEKLHAAFGRAILETWKFAPELVTAVSRHEDLQYRSENGPDYTDVVLVANLHSYLGTSHRLARVSWADIPAFAKLGLTPDESLKALEAAREELREVQQLLAA